LVDKDDLAELSRYKWHRVNAYAYRSKKSKGKQTNTLMHRQIMDAPKGVQVDHINGNGLDNRRSNLRLASQSGQSANSTSQRTSTSRYKGVSWHSKRDLWRATIRFGGKSRHLAYGTDQRSLAKVYDTAAIAAFGEFACLNFPVSGRRASRQKKKVVTRGRNLMAEFRQSVFES
jgi:hypothetical protein